MGCRVCALKAWSPSDRLGNQKPVKRPNLEAKAVLFGYLGPPASGTNDPSKQGLSC